MQSPSRPDASPSDHVPERRIGQHDAVDGESVQIVVWSTDADGLMRGRNPSWSAFSGQTEADASGAGWLAAVDPADRETVERTRRAALRSEAVVDATVRLRRYDGAHRRIALQLVSQRPGDATGAWIWAGVDATDPHHAEAALRSSDERLGFLDGLSRATRALTDAAQVMAVVARQLGTYLHATRCAYADVEADNDRFTIRSDWAVAGVPSSQGVYSLDLFGALAASNLRRGRHLVVADVDAELGDDGGGRMFKAIGIRAIVCAGLVKDGRLVALMAVHQATPRAWTGNEVALIAEVVERCWSHIERVRDAAVRSAAVAALETSQARLQAITNSIDQMVWSTRPDGFHDFYNQRWYEYTGVRAGSTDGEAWNGMFHPDDQERAWSTWRDSLRTGAPYRIEYRLRHHSGAYRWVLGRAQPVRDAEGGISRWYGTCTDIQDIVDAREVLAREHHDLERTVEARTRERDQAWKRSLDLQAVVDASGIIRAANDAWTAILGWEPGEVVGRSHLGFSAPSHRHASAEALTTALHGSLPVHETLCQHKDGSSRWIAWVAASEDGFVYASGRNVTPEKEAAEALEATRQQLRQSQKMEAVGQLTGGIAHDFNNLLAGTSASLELLGRRLAQGRIEGIDKYVRMAQDTTRRATTLTQRLLAFSRRQTLAPRPTDVNRLVAGLEDLIRRTVGPAVQVESVAADDLWVAAIDASQLENALLNLCINARDAMLPGGGRLVVETRNLRLDAPEAEVRELVPGAYLCVTVSDTGSGMSEEVVQRAFEPFFTTKPLGQGTGLGLSMIYGFVRQSGGAVRIESEVGRGTSVSMCFPRHLGAADGVDAGGAASTIAPRGDGRNVLVVDDEPTIRRLIAEVLEEAGYRVAQAEDGAAGLSLLQSERRIEVLITDVGLPGGLNGRQVADAALSMLPALKVLFVTGYAETAALGDGTLPPGMAVLTKPFEMATLTRKVAELLEADAPNSEPGEPGEPGAPGASSEPGAPGASGASGASS